MTISPLAAGVVLTLSREELPAGRPLPGRHCSLWSGALAQAQRPMPPTAELHVFPAREGALVFVLPRLPGGPAGRGAALLTPETPPATEVAGGRLLVTRRRRRSWFFW